MIHRPSFLWLLLFFFATKGFSDSDPVQIENKTSGPIFIGVYRIQEKGYKLEGSLQKILSKHKIELPITLKPSKIAVFFSEQETSLQTNFLEPPNGVYLLDLKVRRISGSLKDEEYIIYKKNENLHFSTNESYYTNHFKRISKEFVYYYKAKSQIVVRVSQDLGGEEKRYLSRRQPKVKEALEQLFQDPSIEVKNPPTIAFCFSGGGYRAMIATLGFLGEAEEAKILQTSTYLATVSGSTWAVNPWMISKKPLKEYQHSLSLRVQEKPNKPKPDAMEMLLLLSEKILSKQKISTVDIYGALLANKLLEEFENPQFVRASSVQKILSKSDHPLPINTAVTPLNSTSSQYEWVEFTPFEVGGCRYLQAFVPVSAFGRRFENGLSVKYAVEPSLGYFLGIFGSAFSFSLADVMRVEQERILALSKRSKLLPDISPENFEYLKEEISDLSLSQKRFATKVNNFIYQLENPEFKAQEYLNFVKDKEYLEFVDSGMDFNLPFPPLFRRNVDIIIACDSSADAAQAIALKKMQAYATREKIALPPIGDATEAQKFCFVFQDEDPKTPTIIYIPLKKNVAYHPDFDPAKSDFCKTTNFEYTREEFELLSGLAAFNFKSSRSEILEVLKKIVREKNQ